MKKLYRSNNDKVFAGIIGGLGEYFEVDPILLRLSFVVLVLITGFFPGVIAYIIALFIVPESPHSLSTIVTPPPMKKPTDKPKPEDKKEVKSEPVVEKPVTPSENINETKEEKVEDINPEKDLNEF